MLNDDYVKSMTKRGFTLSHKSDIVNREGDKELEYSGVGFQFTKINDKGEYVIRHYSRDKMQIRSWRK